MPLLMNRSAAERHGSLKEPWGGGLPPARRLLLHPRFRGMPPPLIVIGMHRSGTSLVSAMLATLGVYMGPEWRSLPASESAAPDARRMLSGYAEAEEFRCLNDQLLADAGASWSRIEPFLARRHQPAFMRPRLVSLGLSTFGRLRHRYLRALPTGFSGPWGWKDPRTSLTLPYWLHLFPDARILHVRRDRRAVIDSLHHRARVWQAAPAPPLPPAQRARQWVQHPGTTMRRAGHRLGLLPSGPPDPCLDRAQCGALCDAYVRECLRFRSWGERYQEVWYEAILADPSAAARDLAAFAGCGSPVARLAQAAALVHAGHGPGAAGATALPHPRLALR